VSSDAYLTEIYPDARLRRVVLATGTLLAVAGVVLIAYLPFPLLVKMVGVLTWSVCVTWELTRLANAYAACRALRFSSEGDIAVQAHDLEWHTAAIASGGLLLRRVGWIRVTTGSGDTFGELVCGNCRLDRNWRRLHVIWRHVGAPD
jgi:hypothetical protein